MAFVLPQPQKSVDTFNVEKFEYLVFQRRHEEAGRMLMLLLRQIDHSYGNIPKDFLGRGYDLFSSEKSLVEHVFTRLVAAICCLFADQDFQLSQQGFSEILPLQRWLSILFAFTPIRNADHILRSLNNAGWDNELIEWRGDDVLKLMMLSLPDSQVPIGLDGIWEAAPLLTASLCMVWVSPRFLNTPAAHYKRELVLGWLPERLKDIKLEELPLGIVHDVYMHCSYAQREDRHQIKREIHIGAHEMLARANIHDLEINAQSGTRTVDGKPVMLVLMEWFSATHSVYRTHSRSLLAAREHFHIIGMGYSTCLDSEGIAVFDSFVPIPEGNVFDQLRLVREIVKSNHVSVLYMPAVGMFLLTILAASLRLAPIQVAALGHGASTQSPWVDYFAVDEDFVGEERTYSEELIKLPVDAMPFVHSKSLDVKRYPVQMQENPEVVNISIAATTMKLNPEFLHALSQVNDRVQTPVHFHFFVGQATQLIWPLVERMVSAALGTNATVHQHLPYEIYLEQMNKCDMFITPFPYGNMNGIADAAILGLLGVCKRGPHVHESIDAGLFHRLGFPDWTITDTVEDYICAVVRLVDHHEERIQLRKNLLKDKRLNTLYTGRPEILAEKLLECLAQWKVVNASIETLGSDSLSV